MQCETCGKSGQLFVASIEGAQMTVCKSCLGPNKVIKRIKTDQEKKQEEKKEAKNPVLSSPVQVEVIETIVDDYAMKIRRAREKRGLNQEEFAKALNEKSSVIGHLEREKLKPSLKLAKKLQSILHIELIEVTEETPVTLKSEKSEGFTIGDMIKIKKK